jgi:hypothetical protein
MRPVDLSTAYASINSAVAPVVYAYGALPLTDIVVAMAEGGLLAGAPPKVIARWLQDPVSMSSGKIRSFNELMGPNRASAFEAMLRWLFDEYETTCSPLRRYFLQRPDLDAKVWVPFFRGTVWAYHDSKLASRLLDLTTPIVNKAPGLEPLFLAGSLRDRRQQLARLYLIAAEELGSLPLANYAMEMERSDGVEYQGIADMKLISKIYHRHEVRQMDWRRRSIATLKDEAKHWFAEYVPAVIAARRKSMKVALTCAAPLGNDLLGASIRSQARRDATLARLGAKAWLDRDTLITVDEAVRVASQAAVNADVFAISTVSEPETRSPLKAIEPVETGDEETDTLDESEADDEETNDALIANEAGSRGWPLSPTRRTVSSSVSPRMTDDEMSRISSRATLNRVLHVVGRTGGTSLERSLNRRADRFVGRSLDHIKAQGEAAASRKADRKKIYKPLYHNGVVKIS